MSAISPIEVFQKNQKRLLLLFHLHASGGSSPKNKSDILRMVLVLFISTIDNYFDGKFQWIFNELLSRSQGRKAPDGLRRILGNQKRVGPLLQSHYTGNWESFLAETYQNRVKEISYQKPEAISKELDWLGMDSNRFWKRCASEVDQVRPNNPIATDEALKTVLRSFAERRDRIVHQADLDEFHKEQVLTKRYIKDNINLLTVFILAADRSLDELIAEASADRSHSS